MKGGGEKGPFCDSSLSIRKWTQKMRFIREKLTIFHFFLRYLGTRTDEAFILTEITYRNSTAPYSCWGWNKLLLMIWETILAKLKTLKALLETILSSQVTYTDEPIFGKLNTDGTFFCETHLLLYKESFSRLDFFFFTKCHAYLEDFAKKCLSSSFSNQSPDSGDGLFQSN